MSVEGAGGTLPGGDALRPSAAAFASPAAISRGGLSGEGHLVALCAAVPRRGQPLSNLQPQPGPRNHLALAS